MAESYFEIGSKNQGQGSEIVQENEKENEDGKEIQKDKQQQKRNLIKDEKKKDGDDEEVEEGAIINESEIEDESESDDDDDDEDEEGGEGGEMNIVDGERKKRIKSEKNSSTETKTFVCTECQSTFYRLNHLERHRRKHTGEKPYECFYPDCHTSFSRFDNMVQHFYSHFLKGYRRKRNCTLKESYVILKVCPNIHRSRYYKSSKKKLSPEIFASLNLLNSSPTPSPHTSPISSPSLSNLDLDHLQVKSSSQENLQSINSDKTNLLLQQQQQQSNSQTSNPQLKSNSQTQIQIKPQPQPQSQFRIQNLAHHQILESRTCNSSPQSNSPPSINSVPYLIPDTTATTSRAPHDVFYLSLFRGPVFKS